MDQVWTFERVEAFGHWLRTQPAQPPAAHRQLGQIIAFLAQQCDDQARALAESTRALQEVRDMQARQGAARG